MARILIADDDRYLLELWDRVLGRRGHEVEVYACGRAAVEALAEPGARYDLVIADMRMAEASGVEVVEAARRHHAGVPAVLVSGTWLPEERDEAMRAGADRLLNKPCDATLIASLATELCRAGRAGSAGAEASVADRDGPLCGNRDAGALPEPWEPPPEDGAAPDDDPLEVALRLAEARAHRPRRDAADAPGSPAFDACTLEPPGPEAGDDDDDDDPALRIAPPQVLLVEADACARRLLTYCLERQGCRVADAAGLGEAIELAEMDTPDVLVIGSADDEVTLGDALRRFRRDDTLRHAPVIVLFDQSAFADAVSALDAGADLALERPYEPDLLFAHVRAAVRRGARVHEARRAAAPRGAGAPRIAARGPAERPRPAAARPGRSDDRRHASGSNAAGSLHAP